VQSLVNQRKGTDPNPVPNRVLSLHMEEKNAREETRGGDGKMFPDNVIAATREAENEAASVAGIPNEKEQFVIEALVIAKLNIAPGERIAFKGVVANGTSTGTANEDASPEDFALYRAWLRVFDGPQFRAIRTNLLAKFNRTAAMVRSFSVSCCGTVRLDQQHVHCVLTSSRFSLASLSLLSVSSPASLLARVSPRPRLFSPVPSRLKCTEVTGSECAGSFFNSFPVFTSQIRTVSSKLPLTIRFDCGLKLTHMM
jgi:hypothetical protein